MGSNQYNIKYSSMDQLYIDICTKTQGWYQQLDSWKTSYTSLINMTSFNGQSATAVKSYLGEVHEFLLQSIYVAISRFQADYLLYKNKYYTIEDNIYATMSRETIKSIEDKLSNEVKYLNNISNEIDRSLSSISDIYWRGKPSKEALEGYFNSEKNSLVAFNNSIENYENTQYSVANGELKSLLEALKSTIVLYSGSTNSVLSYKSGDLINKTQVLDLYNKVQSSIEYVENNKEEIELATLNQQEVFSQMQKDYEEALEAREDEGRVKIITGALAVVVGGAAIILTAGAATPIVVTAAVAGTGSMVYGASNIAEGKEDVYYASIGDLNSVAINPIRDTVFMGNQGVYDLWGNLNMVVAGLCIPVSQAVNGVAGASKSIIAKEAVKAIGKEASFAIGVDWASSNITNFAAGELELNQTESTLLNLGLNFGIGIGGYKLRTKFFGEASFAKGMSYDDAKRYNDYWKQVESGNNTGYPGLSDVDVKLWKFTDNKLNNHIALNKVDFNEVVKLRLKELELENSLRGVDKGVSKADKLKLSSWKYAPDEELYLKYKKVFDNPKYFDQATGDKRWPGQYGDPNIDGFLNGLYEDVMLKPGSKIDRYGGNNGTFFAEEGITIPQRAMAADSDFSTYNIYEIKREIPMRQGEIAPWFDEVGGGIQYQINPEFVKIIRSKLMPGESLIDGLIRLGYLKRL